MYYIIDIKSNILTKYKIYVCTQIITYDVDRLLFTQDHLFQLASRLVFEKICAIILYRKNTKRNFFKLIKHKN